VSGVDVEVMCKLIVRELKREKHASLHELAILVLCPVIEKVEFALKQLSEAGVVARRDDGHWHLA
jgi:predicted transcriptional regulator